VRLDEYAKRDDDRFLMHSLAFSTGAEAPRIELQPVKITKLAPRDRVYGGQGKQVTLT
jgi:fumarate reductase flavoprotein subunit